MRSHGFYVLGVLLIAALGCRNQEDTAQLATTDDGAAPIVDDGTDDNGETTERKNKEPGKIVTPTVDVSGERNELRELDVSKLVDTLDDPKLGDLATDELVARGSEAVKPLIAVLNDGDDAAKQRAAFTLGRLGSQASDALPQLKSIAASTDNVVLRDTANFAIDAIQEQ